MGGDGSRELRERRSVEISAALFVGVTIVTRMLGFGWWAAPPRELWDPIAQASRLLGFALGLVVALRRLLRARRRGV